MEKRTTGEIHNLHKNFLLQSFLASSPSDEEKALREKLVGKGPIQAIEVIAEDFVLKFGDVSKVGLDIRLFLKRDGRYLEWGELDKRVQDAHRMLTRFGQPQAAAYLDKLRNILFSLPNKVRREDLPMYDQEKKNGIKKEDKKIYDREYTKPRDAARNFGICHLCWRSVPRPPRGNKILYCHQHTYGEKPSRQPEHRRRARIKIGDPSKGRPSIDERVRVLKAEIHMPLMRNKSLSATERNTYYAKLCLQPDGPLPMLAQFLRQKGITEPDCEAIGRALEDDTNIPYERLSELNRKAWQFFFAVEMKRHFYLYWKKLFLAEAWLRGDAELRVNPKRTY